jgi:hypothetical protein
LVFDRKVDSLPNELGSDALWFVANLGEELWSGDGTDFDTRARQVAMAGRGFLAIGILLFQLVGTTLAADTLATHVEDLFDTAAVSPSKALDTARAQYKQLRNRPDFDARAKYAFALVLVQQHRFDEGRRVLDEALKEQPDMLPAWQTKIWAALAAHTYAVALDDMRAAAVVLEQRDAKASGDSRTQREDLARLLGRGIGFLAATEKTKIPAEKLQAAREAILAKLGSDRDAFRSGEQSIVAEITSIDEKLAAARDAQESTVSQQEQEQKLKQRSVGKAVAEVDYRILKSETETKTQLKSQDWEIDQAQLKLAKAQFRLNGIDMALMAQQQELQASIQALETAKQAQAAGKIVNQSDVYRVNNSLPLLNNNIRQLGMQHVALCETVAELQAQLAVVVGQRDGLVGKSDQDAAELEAQARKLKHDEKKIEYARKQAQPASGNSGRKHALTQQRQAFSSFEQFPFEQQKQLVLAWFKK